MNGESKAQGIGLWVIALLAVLTAIEFVVYAALDSTAALILLLGPIALAKAWLIVTYFMHASRLWQSEGTGNGH
ncbi:MAG: cytochrome C oxidase subunit IV family protein [Dehalococcoidia bacterium]|jgi:cytochrome c oxidase subunit IV|nr:cytochrome C oxidase subunit IV family protein [Dehalococcoidia bacterium]|tara:strand:+ start:56 stop:277 length:222 start_codon:yes stop_codon:yes gene_type:complete